VVPLAVLTTNGHRGTSAQSNSDLSARGEWAEHTATRDSLNRCTTRTAVDVTCPRTTATSTFPRCTAASASSVRIKLTVVPVPRSNKATVPCAHRLGNNQLIQGECSLAAARRRSRVPARRGRVRHGRGTSVRPVLPPRVANCGREVLPERIFELLDGTTQRRLGDRELVGGLGE
jgi:hypothetical protein